MSNCAVCSTKLKFGNKVGFGGGNLNDGNSICRKCFKDVSKKDIKIANNLKQYSLTTLNEALQEKQLLKIEQKQQVSDNNSKYEILKEHISKLNVKNAKLLSNKNEVKELPQILQQDETVLNIIAGVYKNGFGLLIVTQKRLIFIDKGLIYGLVVEDFPLKKITSIQYETGLLTGKIKINTSNNSATIDQTDKESAKSFCSFARIEIDKAESNNEPKQIDVFEKLEKLSKLKDAGILSDAEFLEQKTKLLGQV